MNRSREANQLYFGMILFLVGMALVFNALLNVRMNAFTAVSFTECLVLLPVLLYLIASRGEVLRNLPLHLVKIRPLLWVMLFALLLMPTVMMLNLLSQLFVPNYVMSSLASTASTPLIVSLLFNALLPAVVEEYIFRGVLFACYRPTGLWKSALVTGLFFGLTHLNLNQFAYAFVVGVLLAFLMEASGSLFAPMVVHFLINTVSVVYAHVLSRLGGVESGTITQIESTPAAAMPLWFWTLLAVITLVTLVLAIRVLVQISHLSGTSAAMKSALRGKDRLRGKEGRVSTLFLYGSIAVGLAYMVLRLVAKR